jgi:pimeloyl-ACP methyl ester carboxylesterase
VRIKWESQGDGAPVLLMHGLGYTRKGWGPLRALLARRYCVISYDNRGIGESEIPPGPYSVAALAADAVGVLDEAGVERAHLLAASLGGFAAQVVASEHPRRSSRPSTRNASTGLCSHALRRVGPAPSPSPKERFA